jgi:hypothetical protein
MSTAPLKGIVLRETSGSPENHTPATAPANERAANTAKMSRVPDKVASLFHGSREKKKKKKKGYKIKRGKKGSEESKTLFPILASVKIIIFINRIRGSSASRAAGTGK